ncbi:GNAT family N-acetyltransferase [Roseibium sp. RKSG952]|nr:GNAT family N-acetyltransferase [Roseibium sp. RKSG952]
MTKETTSIWHAFAELSAHDLHALLKLRQDVFIVEQECAYPDIDGLDPVALHLLVFEAGAGDLVGALRLFAGSESESARIGRVVIAPAYRGSGLGRTLMESGLAKARALSPGGTVEVSAQAHLDRFYASLGFKKVSETYLEDGIPHIDMRLTA